MKSYSPLILLLTLAVHTVRFVWQPNPPEDQVTRYHVYDVTPDYIVNSTIVQAVSWQENRPGDTHSWVREEFLGQPIMRALPDIGTIGTVGPETPALKFNLTFPSAGSYYMWVRGNAIRYGNSLHVKVGSQTIENIPIPTGDEWSWSSSTSSGSRATFTVATPGTFPVELLMREDGLGIERILFTLDPQADPRTNKAKVFTTTATSATLTNVALPIPRTFAATAENQAGESKLSNTATVKEDMKTPTQPSQFQAEIIP